MCGLFITFHCCLNHQTFVDLPVDPDLCAPGKLFHIGPWPGGNYSTAA